MKGERNNEYIHYEGSLSYKEMLIQLSKYDIGLAFLNTTPCNYVYVMKTAAPNKIWEYLSAQIPVAINIKGLFSELVKNYNEAKWIDVESKTLKEDMLELSKISVSEDFLIKNKFTMDFQINDLLLFYSKVINY